MRTWMGIYLVSHINHHLGVESGTVHFFNKIKIYSQNLKLSLYDGVSPYSEITMMLNESWLSNLFYTMIIVRTEMCDPHSGGLPACILGVRLFANQKLMIFLKSALNHFLYNIVS